MGPRRLSRYLYGEIFASTLLAVAFWAAILLMNNFFVVAGEAIQRDLPPATVLRMVLLLVPNTLVLAIPMGTALGTLVAIGRLSGDQEILAIQGAGLGPGFLVRPVIAHGLTMTLLAFGIYGWVHPLSALEIRKIRSGYVSTASIVAELRPRVFYENLPGMVLYIEDRVAGERDRANGVLLFQEEPGGGLEQLIVARSGQVVQGAGGAFSLDLREGVLHVYRSQRPESYRPSRFERFRPRPIDVAGGWGSGGTIPIRKGVVDLLPGELREEARNLRDETDPIIKEVRERAVWTEIHSRLALPLSCLFFAILALPLGITRARTGKGAGFALSLGIILAYYLVYEFGRRNLALEGRAPAGVSVWAANLLIAVWGAIALRRMRRLDRSGPGPISGLLDRIRRLGVRRSGDAGADLRPGSTNGGGRRLGRLFSLVDLYLARTFLRVFAVALAGVYLIFAMVELRDVLGGLIQGRSPTGGGLLAYYVYFTPGALRFVVPIACLIGATVACALLARAREIDALKAMGMSVRRISLPILGVTAILGGGHFLIQDRVAPESNRRAQQIKDAFEGRAPRTYGLAAGGRWTFGKEGRLYHYRIYDPDARHFQGLSVFTVRFDPPAILEHVFAVSGKGAPGSEEWTLERGWRRTFGAGGGAGEFERFDETTIRFDPPENFERRERTVLAGNDLAEWLSLAEIREEIGALTGSGYDTTRLRVAFHRSLAEPFVPLVMVLLGLPFAFRLGKRGSLYGLGVALVLVLAYWATWAVANALGLESLVAPALAAWGPNVIWAIVGFAMLLRAPS